MLSALLTVVVSAPQSPQAVLGRFKKYMDAHPALSVDFQLSINDAPIKAKGHLVLKRPNQQIFLVTYGKQGLTIRQNGSGTLELAEESKHYEVYAPSPTYAMSGMAVSGLYKYAYPLPIMVGDLIKFVGKGAKMALKAPEKIGGVPVDHVYAENMSRETGIKMDAYLDAQGRLVRLNMSKIFNDESFRQVFDFSKYNPAPPEPAAAFAPIPPLGASPLTLDTRPYPIQIGERPHMAVLSRAERLTGGKLPTESVPTLVAFTFSDCEVASAAEQTMRKLAHLLQSKGVAFVEIISSAAKPVLGSRDPKRTILWDKGGELDHAFKPQGSPSFFFIDKSGTVENSWFGFDGDHPDAFLAEVAAAISSK